MITNVNAYRSLWEPEDAKLTMSEELIERGLITIEEQSDLDWRWFGCPNSESTRATRSRSTAKTLCSRLLILQGRRVEFQYRCGQ